MRNSGKKTQSVAQATTHEKLQEKYVTPFRFLRFLKEECGISMSSRTLYRKIKKGEIKAVDFLGHSYIPISEKERVKALFHNFEKSLSEESK